ncbi:hypothetical protein [Hymenobacter glacialis]|uniref:Uncharacterized protein n=1 Tax=Hymenobacter glacialis TaxID=1908236 RepID=A0A1G1T7V2_9BACT|nr:hypothetical protein [Hymenobacter glacialis]OGX86959.1 hypothetical protein BEN48_00965 [Hymenobacter glacialis]
MSQPDKKNIDSSLAQLQSLHQNMSSMWDGDALAAFYYNVLSGTVARHTPEVAQAIMSMVAEVYENTARSHTNLGKLTQGFPSTEITPAK